MVIRDKVIGMKDLLLLTLRLLAALVTLLGTRGIRALLAENLLLKRQLLVMRRSRRRAPNLRTADRVLPALRRPLEFLPTTAVLDLALAVPRLKQWAVPAWLDSNLQCARQRDAGLKLGLRTFSLARRVGGARASNP
jgi:hypothetical protein